MPKYKWHLALLKKVLPCIMIKLYLTWCNSISECQLSLTRGSCGGLSPGSSQSWPSPEIHLHTLPPANTLPPAKIIIIIIINIIKNVLDCMFVQIATCNQVFLIPFSQRHFQFGWRKFQVSLLMPNLIFGKCTSTFCPFKTILTFLESSEMKFGLVCQRCNYTSYAHIYVLVHILRFR